MRERETRVSSTSRRRRWWRGKTVERIVINRFSRQRRTDSPSGLNHSRLDSISRSSAIPLDRRSLLSAGSRDDVGTVLRRRRDRRRGGRTSRAVVVQSREIHRELFPGRREDFYRWRKFASGTWTSRIGGRNSDKPRSSLCVRERRNIFRASSVANGRSCVFGRSFLPPLPSSRRSRSKRIAR